MLIRAERGNSSGIAVLLLSRRFILLTLTVLAVTTRLLPLSISHLPFNNDGITESRISSDIVASGHLDYPKDSFYVGTHSTAMPTFNVWLAFASSVLGSSPYDSAQILISFISALTICAIYLLAFRLTGDSRLAFVSGVVLCLFGTFVFLTASTWKNSLGVALMVLLFYAYSRRNELRMLLLEIAILASLPVVHHGVAVVAYLSIAYLTLWSLFYGIKERSLNKRHVYDAMIVGLLSTSAIAYYHASSLDRLSDVASRSNSLSLIATIVIAGVATVIVLNMKSHARYSYAPIPATLVFVLFVWDYFDPFFPYAQGAPESVILLAIATCVLIGVAWLGFEEVIEGKSRFRAIPLGMLVPVITLLLYALLSSPRVDSHQIVFRTYDYADPAIAVGIAFGVLHFRNRPKARAYTLVAVFGALLVSLPFAYATGPLTGVRHDTQEYEVDAFDWLSGATQPHSMLQSDERLSYVARALNDFNRLGPSLGYRINLNATLGIGVFYVLETEWTTVGVNDYPNGYLVLNQDSVERTLNSSNVMYVGGPNSNRLMIFEASLPGQSQIL